MSDRSDLMFLEGIRRKLINSFFTLWRRRYLIGLLLIATSGAGVGLLSMVVEVAPLPAAMASWAAFSSRYFCNIVFIIGGYLPPITTNLV